MRDNRRIANWLHPRLPGFDEVADVSPASASCPEPIHLILVHGGTTEPEFAFLRLYADMENPNHYRQLSNDMLKLAVAPSSSIPESEDVPDIDVVLREGLKQLPGQKAG